MARRPAAPWGRPSACAGRVGPQLPASICVSNGVPTDQGATEGDEDALSGGAGPACAGLSRPANAYSPLSLQMSG